MREEERERVRDRKLERDFIEKEKEKAVGGSVEKLCGRRKKRRKKKTNYLYYYLFG